MARYFEFERHHAATRRGREIGHERGVLPLDAGDCLDLAVDQPPAFKAVTPCRNLRVIAPGP